MAIKKWVIRQADKERASQISEKFNIDPFVAFLMVSRGIVDDIDVVNFMTDEFMLSSPFDMADMDEAVFTVSEAIENGDKICVYGDYDCDGVTSTTLLVDFLRSKGADVCYYIPSRETEGYGLNNSVIDEIARWGVNLIITVDNGISAFDEAEHIYELGMSLVVTDHHQLTDGKLPKAEAVVNPHREDNAMDFRDFCGVGVAFKFAVAMDEDNVEDIVERYIDLVAIGTIADVMPLKEENRAFVRRGLQKLNNNPRKSLAPLIKRNSNEITSQDIAFQICPRINAMGRMGDAKRAVEFLLCDDAAQAVSACNSLDEENANRQQVEQEIIEDVKKQIKKNPRLVASPVIVVAGKGYHHGVIGIVAAHILEKYGKPTFVIGIDENGIARGSARSVEGFNIFEALTACSDDMIQFGGHPLAAGITLKEDMIEKFSADINEFAIKNYPVMPQVELTLDFKLSPSYLNLDLVDSLSVLEPYGAGNSQAVFGIYKLRLLGVTPLSEGKHVRLDLQKKDTKIRVVKFSTPYDDFPYKPGDELNLAVKVSKNAYNGKMYLSVQAVDIRLSSLDEDKYFAEKSAYDLYRYTGKVDESLYPTREDCAFVYKYLKKNNGYPYSLENLYLRLQDNITYGKLMFALKAFSQGGLINYKKGITLNTVKEKVNLEETPILKALKGRLNIE
ncbi:single-stranded-DNA-specific exonuclease RecJ [uncultured Eubacterium sp.]|uniref:single-stranded-DNA-specific exonuclease RecJ n=1 Tax=uncultured Eubacterium sp. TaxID=165185 RepID=UPI0026370470|nr:single-stranded-DNA-specific exonuclease RecJ [uncultured Eubacterium sp.]